jgi:hypothetical protein
MSVSRASLEVVYFKDIENEAKEKGRYETAFGFNYNENEIILLYLFL